SARPGCAKRSRSGGGRPWPIWPTSPSPRSRRPGLMSCASQPRRSWSRRGSLSASTRSSCPSWETPPPPPPTGSPPAASLCRAPYRAGRRAEPPEPYQQGRRALVDQLGIEPSPALRELHQAILRQDEELAPPAPPERPRPVEERRKTVTVLFADIVSSTALGE